ncbi:MAG TPA: acyl-CoA dehydrogenase family protein [Solirubrobacterales bacterium]|nr:acyl-CoA dehydrogenase family protein [Solirubrobacterales bacterium]
MAPTASANDEVELPLDLDLNDEQRQLQDATRGFLSRHYPLGDARAILESDREADPEGWRRAAEMGWIAVLADEDAGGLGFSPSTATVISSELGRAVNWTPFLGSALSVAALGPAAGGDDRAAGVMEALIAGETVAAWCGPEPRGDGWGADSVRTEAVEAGDGFVLYGEKYLVADADLADELVVAARVDGELRSFVVPAEAEGVEITVSRTLDLTRRFATVRLNGVRVTAGDAVGEAGTADAAFGRTLDLAIVLVAADAVGAAEKLLELTVEYAADRIAFQRPIASYQAVKHMCADMLLKVEASRAASRYAALTLEADSAERARAVAVAGGYVSGAAAEIAGDALQIHGGVGFTWEHDLHLFLRRIKVDQALFGDTRQHREQLVGLLT